MATSLTWSNISATTSTFTLAGGWYALTVIAGTWDSGTVTLERLAADGSTYVTAATAVSANGMSVVQLPAGTYKLAVASATGIYIDITATSLTNA